MNDYIDESPSDVLAGRVNILTKQLVNVEEEIADALKNLESATLKKYRLRKALERFQAAAADSPR